MPQLGFCASSGRAWWLWAAWYSQGEAGPLGAQPLPRVLEPAASKAADFTAFDHVGAASWVPRAAASPISADRDSVLYPRAPCPLRLVLETAGIVRVLSGHCQGSVHESVRALSSELELGTQ